MSRSFLIIGLLAASAPAQVRVQGAPEVVAPGGGHAGAVPTLSGVGTLSAPSVVPSLSAPLTPVIAQPSVKSVAAEAGLAQAEAQPAPAVALAQPAPAAVLPASVVPAAGKTDLEALSGRAPAAVPGSVPVGEGAEGGALPLKGRADLGTLFDGAAAPARNAVFDSVLAPARSLWGAARTFLRGADQAPAFPPKPDQKVRVGGRTYKLGRLVASTPEWSLHETEDRETAVLVFSPEAKAAYASEKAALEGLSDTAVPHPQLKAAADGVLVLVRRGLDGWRTRDILAQGIRKNQLNGLADLAANLIRARATADLSPDSVLWEHWKGHWAFQQGTGFRPGAPAQTLSQLWAWPGGVADRAAFLAALRSRLGPDSADWKRVAAERDGEVRAALDELAKRDAARAPPKPLKFGPGRTDAALSNELVSPRELAKRLGYDPFSVKERFKLHADDPGKLNTSVSLMEPNGKRKAVFKGADQEIIRAELFVRKAVRAFFGEYFETPGALAVLRGHESYMVMEEAGGNKSWSQPRLTREQRAAFAVLVHTFGLGDVNPGNVFYGENGAKPWLIDFEQALSRRAPVANRLPDGRILQEMPWVNADEPPPVEDYLPGIKAWREHFAKPETQRAIERMLGESGYGPEEISRAMAVFRANVADLEWTVTADVDFADGLKRR